MKPVIGITTFISDEGPDATARFLLNLKANYVEAIVRSGGVPIIIPPFADPLSIIPMLDGIMVPGGDDIDACHFGEENHPKASLQTPLQYETDSNLLKALPADLPYLGICYGCQILNVVMGGTMNQHIPDDPAAAIHTGGPLQTYRLEPGSLISRVMGSDTVTGKSFHHQAIKQPGSGLRSVGWFEDGTIEAVEATDREWTIGVQWHPERTYESGDSKSLFDGFVAAAARHQLHRQAAGCR